MRIRIRYSDKDPVLLQHITAAVREVGALCGPVKNPNEREEKAR